MDRAQLLIRRAGFESLGAHSAFAACAPFAVPEPSSPCRRCAASRRIRVPGGPLRVRCVRPLRRARALFTLPPLRGFPQDSSPWGPTPRFPLCGLLGQPEPLFDRSQLLPPEADPAAVA
jgi:hypothetical protein